MRCLEQYAYIVRNTTSLYCETIIGMKKGKERPTRQKTNRSHIKARRS